ncbi:hypothetical protein MVEN_02168600 [Mycena venus]|uniref:Zn(2)-C6 fungal-type domain-containing protein n=1 Tax=Mycena venus TaxID=2733690 RepID=A0A8H7CI30_9AGAR|nr:hypothetical protein MVEN_02168600 [Mycena venus]
MKRISPPPSDNPAPKRRKATSQACAACRRQKSRCEILDVPVPNHDGAPVVIRCHRCKVVGIECSFETSNLAHFPPPQTPPAASPGSSRERTVPETASGHVLHLEDIIPTATTPASGSVLRVDWTATPILAIEELVRCPRRDMHQQPPGADRLSEILNPQEITSLLDIFETRYAPWLCAQPRPAENSNSFLDIVRCTIASRHLPPAARSAATPRLQKLTNDLFVREAFNPQPSLDSITALLILSIWSPICDNGGVARDVRLLIASAVSMAKNMNLHNASMRVLSLRADKSPHKNPEMFESERKWRLWMYLSISESMLCLGAGRTPVSHFSQLDQDILNQSSPAHLTLSSVRDIRLGLTARLYDMVQNALKVHLKAAQDLGRFFDQINEFLDSLESLRRLFAPFPVITQYDNFYSHMLLLEYSACRLLVLHHAIRETRTVHERDMPAKQWFSATPLTYRVAFSWGRLALSTAESVLTAFLAPSSEAELILLGTAPDTLYVKITVASTWLFVCNFLLSQLQLSVNGTGVGVGGGWRCRTTPAARCAQGLGAQMNVWQGRKNKQGQVKQPHPPLEPQERGDPSDMTVLDIPYARFPSLPMANTNSEGGEEGHVDVNSQQQQQSQQEFGAGGARPGADSNPDFFMDDAFWTSFLQNLDSDALNAHGQIPTAT